MVAVPGIYLRERRRLRPTDDPNSGDKTCPDHASTSTFELFDLLQVLEPQRNCLIVLEVTDFT
jgi:hypothetical protein